MSDDATATPNLVTPPAASPSGSGETTPATPPPPVDWSAHIPKDLAGSKTLEPYKGKPLGEVLKSLHDAQTYAIGAIKLPGEKDQPEERTKKLNDIYTKLGRPAKPEEYKHALPELPGKAAWDEARVGQFNQVAHKIGLNPAQAQELLNFYGEMIGQSVPNERKLYQEGEAALRKDWGAAYDKNVELAGRGYKELMDIAFEDQAEAQAADEKFKSRQLLKDPHFAKMMSVLGRLMQEDGLITGESIPNDNESMDAKIREITSHEGYLNERHPMHDDLVKKAHQLFQQKQPGLKLKREEVYA